MKGIGGPYIHINRNVDSRALKDIENFLKKEVPKLISDKFPDKISIYVNVVEGSIKAYVIFGGITLFNLVSGYGSLRSGIDMIVKDIQTVSSMVLDRLSIRENISPDEIIRQERRLGIPGKIQRYLKKLDGLDDINTFQRTEKIEELKKELLDILVFIEYDRDRAILINSTPKEIQNLLPPNLPAPYKGALDLRFVINKKYITFTNEDSLTESPNKRLPSSEKNGLALPPPKRKDDDE